MKPHDSLFRKIARDAQVRQDLISIAMPDLAPLIRMDAVNAVPDSFTKRLKRIQFSPPLIPRARPI